MVVISYDFVVNCGVEFGWFFYLVFGEFVDCQDVGWVVVLCYYVVGFGVFVLGLGVGDFVVEVGYGYGLIIVGVFCVYQDVVFYRWCFGGGQMEDGVGVVQGVEQVDVVDGCCGVECCVDKVVVCDFWIFFFVMGYELNFFRGQGCSVVYQGNLFEVFLISILLFMKNFLQSVSEVVRFSMIIVVQKFLWVMLGMICFLVVQFV